MKNQEFITAVEKLVNPIEGGAMHVIQQYNQMLPVSIQHKLIKSSSNKNPYMGFIVDPYCLFTCFKITDLGYFQNLIDSNFKLIKTSVFDNDQPEYYVIISSFNVRTSAFFGNRIEAYVICEDVRTGLLTWVIIDVMSNTISYEQHFGLVGANADSIVTTSFDGSVLVSSHRDDIKYNAVTNRLGDVDLLDKRLWIEGNLSVGYGKLLSDNSDVFSLLFDVGEVESAVVVDEIDVECNWFGDAMEAVPNISLVFPYAQHFISSSPGAESVVHNQAEMEAVRDSIDFDNLVVYSSSGMFKLQQRITLGLIVIIIVLVMIILFLN